MTPKEKSIELVNKFLQIYDGRVPQAKQCALICVDEILESHYKVLVGVMPKVSDYWQEVKQEINKL
tara:strand:- start:6408 stop:6605 length:198 start_codon:yes stop_codon:yes gene_type:complete